MWGKDSSLTNVPNTFIEVNLKRKKILTVAQITFRWLSGLVGSPSCQHDLLTVGVTHAIKRKNDKAWSLSPLI